MSARNFWLRAEIDTPGGVKQCLSGGPAAADGGFTLSIEMRDQGKSRQVLTIKGSAEGDFLQLVAVDPGPRPQLHFMATGTRKPTKTTKRPAPDAAQGAQK